jgi:hypothetical protein
MNRRALCMTEGTHMTIAVSPPAPFAPYDYHVDMSVKPSTAKPKAREGAQPFVPKPWTGVNTTDAAYVLYRYFDDDGFLIYAGITNQLNARDEAHMKSTWRPYARLLCIEGFPDRYTVEAAESWVIEAEDPIFNSQRNGPDAGRIWKYPRFIDACDGLLRGYRWDAFILPDIRHMVSPLSQSPVPGETLFEMRKRYFLEEGRPRKI